MSATLSLVAAFPASERSSSCSPSLESDRSPALGEKGDLARARRFVVYVLVISNFLGLGGGKEKEK